MVEKKKEVKLEFDVPEFSKKDIKVKLNSKGIAIKAVKRTEVETNKKGIYHKESHFQSASFVRSFPARINTKKAKVKIEKGRVKVSAPLA